MDLATTLLVGVPAQLVVFTLVPLAWWLHSGRPERSFFGWLGFRSVRASSQAVGVGTLHCGLLFAAAALTVPATKPVDGWSLDQVLALLLAAALQTALAEELFFRGFGLRVLSETRIGPRVANAAQALVCGLLLATAVWLFVDRGVGSVLVALALGAGSAGLAGWLRLRTGSLLPGWAAHGGGNLVAVLVAVALR